MRRFPVLLALALPLRAAAPPAAFTAHTLASDLRGGYQVVVADLNHDGRPDLIALASGMHELVWFENPGWQRHVLASGVNRMINCVVAGNEIVLASEFNNEAKNSAGVVGVLRPGGRCDAAVERSPRSTASPPAIACAWPTGRRADHRGERGADRGQYRSTRLPRRDAAGLLRARGVEAARDRHHRGTGSRHLRHRLERRSSRRPAHHRLQRHLHCSLRRRTEGGRVRRSRRATRRRGRNPAPAISPWGISASSVSWRRSSRGMATRSRYIPSARSNGCAA